MVSRVVHLDITQVVVEVVLIPQVEQVALLEEPEAEELVVLVTIQLEVQEQLILKLIVTGKQKL